MEKIDERPSPGFAHQTPVSLPARPSSPSLGRAPAGSPLAAWGALDEPTRKFFGWVIGILVLCAALGAAFLWAAMAIIAEDPWDSSTAKGGAFAGAAVALLFAADFLLKGATRSAFRIPRRSPRPEWMTAFRARTARIAAAGAVVVGVAILWAARPVAHGVAILLYEYPLATWMPLLVVPVVLAVAVAVGACDGRAGVRRAVEVALTWQTLVVFATWCAAMIALPGLQGHALAKATSYVENASLPPHTQPRLLPKEAAQANGTTADLRDTHLVVDPVSGALVYSSERKHGAAPRGASNATVLQPLDRIDGSLAVHGGGFRPATSEVGPGSLTWRAYDRHFFTRVMERVVVPLRRGGAVVVAPYIGFRGFPVRRPFWQGVYVLHQDGRLEDLTPRQAMARPELAASGHLFPEKLARDLAEAYGYGKGPHTVVTDESDDEGAVSNRQPYLTNLGDGRVRWVTVAHAPYENHTVTAVFLTDSVTGRTKVWHAPPRSHVLSNEGAVDLVRKLHLRWSDSNGDEIRRAAEPRPVFLRGRLYYLVSVVPEHGFTTTQAVDRTVVVDALARRIVRVYDHADSEADDSLRAFFGITPRQG